jgi:Zn-dependent protease
MTDSNKRKAFKQFGFCLVSEAMNLFTIETLMKVATYYLPFLFALCFHEWAHGMVAKIKGDNTAEMMGRLTLNPVPHLDILGTVILPILAIATNLPIFFGWAKPVPVNPRNLSNPRVDTFWIALAGPMSNVLLAVVGAFLWALTQKFSAHIGVSQALIQLLEVFITLNMFLAIFNILPINPLDGGKVIARFLPAHIAYKLEQAEATSGIILMILIFSGALRFLAIPVFWASQNLIEIAGFLIR